MANTARFVLVSCLVYSSTLTIEATVPCNRQLTFTVLYGVISQKTEPFMDNLNHKKICGQICRGRIWHATQYIK
jgi:hypothetical protein